MPNNSLNDSSLHDLKNKKKSSRQTSHSKTITLIGIISIIVAIFIVTIASIVSSNINRPSSEASSETSPSDEEITDNLSPPHPLPNFIDLQPTVNQWLATTNAQIGLMIYDLDHHQIAASHQADVIFYIASIYKLFYVYSGYRLIDANIMDADEIFITTNDYRAGNYTFSECLDLMIRESYNGCADPMRENSFLSNYANNLINELNLTNTTDLGLYSTATDLTKLLIHVWEHSDLTSSSWQQLSDSMLNQPPTPIDSETTYDWRQGFPSGFSESVSVYDKVGWQWNQEQWSTYADAAILDFSTLNRHYTAVIIASNLPDSSALSTLAHTIESVISSTDQS